MGIGKIRESKGDWHDIDHTNHQVPFVFESIWKTTYPQWICCFRQGSGSFTCFTLLIIQHIDQHNNAK